jgi:predicted permease
LININLIIELLSKLIFIYIAIIVGILWRFSRFYKEQYGKIFTDITIWVFFPITIIVAIITIQSVDISIFLLILVLALFIHIGSYLMMLYTAKFRLNKNNSFNSKDNSLGSQAMVATFPNFIFYPFPVILATIGDSGILYATFFVFFTMLIRNTFGVYIGIHHSLTMNEESKNLMSNLKNTIIEVAKFPPFLATLIGFILLFIFGSQDLNALGGDFNSMIQLIKDTSMILALLVIGLSFNTIKQLQPANLFSRKTLEVGWIRFIFSPIIAISFALLTQLPSVAAFPVIIQCMAPPAVSNIIYAKFFGLPEDEISIYVTSLTFIALFILPFELLLLQTIFPY